MENQESARKVAEYIMNLPDFTWHVCPFPYGHMGASIVDASLQAGIDYEKVVRKRVKALRNAHPTCVTTSAFAALIKEQDLSTLIDWPGKGKLSRIRAAVKLFLDEKIETEKDLYFWIDKEENSKALREIKGIGPKTFDYYRLIAGHSTVAVDRHLKAFIKLAGVTVASYEAAQRILTNTAAILKKDARDLDHSIWKYMSNKGCNS